MVVGMQEGSQGLDKMPRPRQDTKASTGCQGLDRMPPIAPTLLHNQVHKHNNLGPLLHLLAASRISKGICFAFCTSVWVSRGLHRLWRLSTQACVHMCVCNLPLAPAPVSLTNVAGLCAGQNQGQSYLCAGRRTVTV
eukprot:350803-Chlamydomonas_euryale.AAC.2